MNKITESLETAAKQSGSMNSIIITPTILSEKEQQLIRIEIELAVLLVYGTVREIENKKKFWCLLPNAVINLCFAFYFDVETSLRSQYGQQFGIPLQSIQGTIKFADYASRIPKILINLRKNLKANGGFSTNEIFRFHADSNEFAKFKHDLENNGDAKTNDIHSISNAIKAFYYDLPIKVLTNINIERIESVQSIEDVVRVINIIKEPYKSALEWLLDLCVEIISKGNVNNMSHRAMAVVLCPLLYKYNTMNNGVRVLRSVMEFTNFAIQWRVGYRKKYPNKYSEECIKVIPHTSYDKLTDVGLEWRVEYNTRNRNIGFGTPIL